MSVNIRLKLQDTINEYKEYWWVQVKTKIRRSAFVASSKCRLFVALKRYIVPSLATTINVYNNTFKGLVNCDITLK